jgi:hypothetical protein
MICVIRDQLLDRLYEDVVLGCCKSAISSLWDLLRRLWDVKRDPVRRSPKRVRRRKRSKSKTARKTKKGRTEVESTF